jgi:hypothetical protein
MYVYNGIERPLAGFEFTAPNNRLRLNVGVGPEQVDVAGSGSVSLLEA